MPWAVNWDNGAGASGTFSQRFATEAEAEAFGQEWADECNIRDFGTATPWEPGCMLDHVGGEGYSFEIIEVPDEGDPDDCQGLDWERMIKECRP